MSRMPERGLHWGLCSKGVSELEKQTPMRRLTKDPFRDALVLIREQLDFASDDRLSDFQVPP